MSGEFTCQMPDCEIIASIDESLTIIIVSKIETHEGVEFQTRELTICEFCHEAIFSELDYPEQLNAAISEYVIEKWHEIEAMPEPGAFEEGLQTGLTPIMDLLLHKNTTKKEDQGQ